VQIPERESPSDKGQSKVRTLRDEVARINGVDNVSLSNTPPSSGSVSGTGFKMEGDTKEYETQVKLIDGNYLSLYGMELKVGDDLQDLDTIRGFVVNEKLAAMVGYTNPSDIIGKNMSLWKKKFPVVGVVKNFHTVSLHQAIEPVAMFNRTNGYHTLSIKVNQAKFQEAVKQVQQKWEAAYPEYLFSYKFLDAEIKDFYEREEKMSTLLSVFTLIAIFIGCLGLFGLATFMANQKTKEIGVRKVLGASVESIVLLFSKEYIKLLLVGFALAAPLAWYVMNRWLSDFAYKINIGPLIFIAGLGATFTIAIATVGYRSFKAATINPVDSLRSE
jgi:putative ABC transport system permease protein